MSGRLKKQIKYVQHIYLLRWCVSICCAQSKSSYKLIRNRRNSWHGKLWSRWKTRAKSVSQIIKGFTLAADWLNSQHPHSDWLKHVTHQWSHQKQAQNVITLLSNCTSEVLFYVIVLLWLFLSWWQPTDLTEPNPITILLLCIHLYQRLPHYLPRATVAFEGPLHDTVTKHVSLFLLSSDTLLHYFTTYNVARCIQMDVNLTLLFYYGPRSSLYTLSQKFIDTLPRTNTVFSCIEDNSVTKFCDRFLSSGSTSES